MKIIDVLKNKSQEDTIASKLLNLANDIIEQSNEHLKLTMHQLPEYDLHDESHSKKVLENIEKLIPEEKMKLLSKYELFLLYLSAYLHDCAMALPNWELKLLKLTEGTKDIISENIEKPIAHDFKAPFKLSEAMEIIEERKNNLYESYDKVKDFIFISGAEPELKKDLAERLIKYQEFRNGYTDDLKKIVFEKNLNKYLKYSDFIRHEFVRTTHASRAQEYIRNLYNLFVERLGGSWARSLVNDLAMICKSHGESFDYIKKMDMQVNYFDSETVNLQFIAVMLRLGDIIHFSYDRAPKSLLAEKMIRSEESLKHWQVKLQSLTYTMDNIDNDGRKVIKYMAYCEEPSSYYFIHTYMDWVDKEISNYYKFIHNIEYSINTRKHVDKYKINIANRVDRDQIKYNEQKFTPVNNLSFSLNQRKVIELLMGVGLYKDKYLCLREIYQNALDACRCMISFFSESGIDVDGQIEFGIGETIINGNNKKYLYCLDNGIGMTKEIIEKYLLNIGDSYYKSKDFFRRSIKWKNSFKPTSQFGIGILSYFMLGNRIEITSKPINDSNYDNSPLRFSIDGPHEYFYYMKPDQLDLERIGSHGTLVKIYLKKEEEINSSFIEELPLIIHGQNNREFKESRKDIFEKWDNNLYKLLLDFISIVPPNINVKVQFSNEKKEELILWSDLFYIDKTEFSEQDLKLLYSNRRYINDGYNPYEDYFNNKEFIKTELITVAYEGIEYYLHLNLPKKGIKCKDYRVLDLPSEIYKQYKSILIDGIDVSKGSILSHMELDHRRDLFRRGIFNFIGEERPQLSVDRNTITHIPDTIIKRLEQIPNEICKKIIKKIKIYFNENKIENNSLEARMTWDYIFNKFSSSSQELIKVFIEDQDLDILIDELYSLVNCDDKITLDDFINLEELKMINFNYKFFSPTIKLIVLGKIANAEKININDREIEIISKEFNVVNYKKDASSSELIPLLIKADKWTGIYSEYDLVSFLWPIVPNRLFKKVESEQLITKRLKKTHLFSNSLAGIADLDPVLINPKFGISTIRSDPWNHKKNLVGQCGKEIQNDFSMFEFNNNKEFFDEKKDYFVYSYISPRDLNDKEKITLEDYKEKDSVYYNGVLEGWSILFLGKTSKYIIAPGIVKRKEMIEKINDSFWEINKDITYYFLDGEQVK